MNDTMVKFGFPDNVVADFDHWVVLMRPQQVTLGALVLAAKSDATSFAALPAAAYAELAAATSKIEKGLRAFRDFDRINYLMLMMVDPHVHFHVLPRYRSRQQFQDLEFADAGWPGPPDLKSAPQLASELSHAILRELKTAFSSR
jgi:diadenosine tetraphosphate (Ap4A) HIT family hydrolase